MIPKLGLLFASASLALVACGGQLGGDDGGTTDHDDGGTTATTEGGPPDAAIVCVDPETSDFDTSCSSDDDCIAVAAGGPVCDGYACFCPNATISADSEGAYQAMLAKVKPATGGMCGCPLLGVPHCIASECVFCPPPSLNEPLPPGCPDGGP